MDVVVDLVEAEPVEQKGDQPHQEDYDGAHFGGGDRFGRDVNLVIEHPVDVAEVGTARTHHPGLRRLALLRARLGPPKGILLETFGRDFKRTQEGGLLFVGVEECVEEGFLAREFDGERDFGDRRVDQDGRHLGIGQVGIDDFFDQEMLVFEGAEPFGIFRDVKQLEHQQGYPRPQRQ